MPILMLFALTPAFLYLQWYTLNLISVSATPAFISGAMFVIFALIGLNIGDIVTRKVLGPLEIETDLDLEETLAEKRQ